MKITVDQTILDKYDLSMEEFLLLYLGAKGTDIDKCTESLLSKGLANKNLFSKGNIIVSEEIKELLTTIVIDSHENVINKDEEYLELANKLRELYPSGRKEGTTYMWRGTTAEIAKKLKTLVVKYNFNFTEEQAIKATQSYINSFNGNYRTMRLLKYFILKSEKDADDNVNIVSEFMSLIENEGQIDSLKDDWMSTMI